MTSTHAGSASPARPVRRSGLRSVALPTEHGGWGLTIEPGLLGLLLRPSGAGVALAVAGVVAFLARTPLKVVAVDARRGRWLPRTTLAARVAAAEVAVLVALVALAVRHAEAPFWIPALVAAPLFAVEAAFEVRSRGRRLVPELAGAIAVGSLAAMVVLAAGGPTSLAVGAWLILAARSTTSIPDVRAQVARLHGRPHDAPAVGVADLTAIGIAAIAVLVEPALVIGAIGIVMLVALQERWGRRPPAQAVLIGVRQLVAGLAIVVGTGLGFAVLGV